ncbi:transglycosylase domain-containing protein [Rubrivirga sp. IMCC45206]|uniref:transglycosylase domain-containing protein n=1 Tax=Rubrivirga sp. IMCC45206 TaxID=3391614 RepID=UPI00398FA276
MDDPTTFSDDDLADFFGSPDARHAALDARRETLSGEDAELGAFFGSPDARGDGASRDARLVEPTGPSAPPPPTGPEAERRRRVGRALAVVLGLVGLGVFAGLGVVAYLSQELPSFEQIENPRNLLATQVLTADGVELARYYDGENRTWVGLDEMSVHVPNALIATEDRRFDEHWGVDMYAIGAIIKDFATGRGARGASTITMQLARNLYRDATGYRIGERSVVRKAKEILIAVRIERTYTKPEILEAYLNTVPFLYNAYGIEAASQTFFSKPAADLDPNEAATLVGMLAANSRYNPCLAPDGTSAECLDADGEVLTVSQNQAAIDRRNVVLTNMLGAGVLDQAAYAEAREAPIQIAFDVYSHEDNLAPHFAEVLRMWFREWAEANDYDPYKDGLVIRTTIDSRMQALASQAVAEQMDLLQDKVNRGWGSASNPFGYWWSRNAAVVDEYIGQTDRYRSLVAGDLSAEAAVAQLRRDGVFMDSLKTARTRLEAGLIAMDPQSGQVKAWVGGRNFVVNKYDHGGQARRQPGSTFKLFVYTTAFDNGYSPQSGVFDSPFKWGDWAPKNSGNSYAGYTTLAEGLRSSRNVVAARITKHFGTAEVARTAYQLGIRTRLELPEFDAETCPPFEARKNDCYARSIGLGTQDLSLLEMVTAYATVANYGVYHGPTLEENGPQNTDIPPHIVLAVDRIEDRYGNVIADFTPVAREVLNPSTAYTTFDAMRAVVRAGTGRGLGSFRGVGALDVAGKTGTTQENADGWFIGMTPELVVGSWTGFDDRRITYPSTSIGQGGRTGLMNVGAFLSKLQTEGPDDIQLDADRQLERPDNYQPPTRRSRIGDAGYWPGDSRSRRSGGTRSRNSSDADRPAREILDGFREREQAQPRPPTQGGSGGRIGW